MRPLERKMMAFAMFVAVLSCTLFSGAAIYINLVEHPARMSCDTTTARAVWAVSYQRAVPMMASLAVISFLSGVAAYVLGGSVHWLIGAVLIGLVVPFTFLGIMPTNKQLLAPGRDPGASETRILLERWGRLHAVRTALSSIASLIFLYALIGGIVSKAADL